MQWITSGSNGKPYANWALPGAAYSYAIQAYGRNSVDIFMLKNVSTRFTSALDPGQKRIYTNEGGGSDEESD